MLWVYKFFIGWTIFTASTITWIMSGAWRISRANKSRQHRYNPPAGNETMITAPKHHAHMLATPTSKDSSNAGGAE